MYDRAEFFKTYFDNASEKKLLVKALGNIFQSFPAALKILDLGCHDGELIYNILKSYPQRLTNQIELTGVDPSKAAVTCFLQRDFGPTVAVRAFNETAETYFNSHDENYDWVIASQCLYWSKDLATIVKKISAAGKQALIVLRAEKGIHQIQSTFQHLLGNQDEQLFTANDIELALQSQQISYRRNNYTTYISLPDENSMEYIWLINFFLQTDESVDYDAVKKYINEHLGNPLQHDISFFWLNRD